MVGETNIKTQMYHLYLSLIEKSFYLGGQNPIVESKSSRLYITHNITIHMETSYYRLESYRRRTNRMSAISYYHS